MSKDLSDWGNPNGKKKKRGLAKLTRENILFALGIFVIIFELIDAEYLGRSFHFEFLILGASLCGISITQWSDRK